MVYQNYVNVVFIGLLYRAPELLRITDSDEEEIGSQKGDIYSFSIILYELHGRQGPFGETNLSFKEILDKVSQTTEPVFRYANNVDSNDPFHKYRQKSKLPIFTIANGLFHWYGLFTESYYSA